MHAVTQEWVRRTCHGGLCLAMSVSLLAGCDSVPERSTTEERWDSAGTAVVEHTTLGREDGAELTPTLILSVEAVEGMPPFGQLADVSILTGGRLAVADAGTRRVHMLAPDGTHEWSEGSEGDGPGQFRGIDRLIVAPEDSLLAVDVQLGRLTPISTAGGVGAPERLLPDAGVPVGRMETGSLLYRQQRPEGERRLGIQHTVATWASVDRRSGERQVIATMPGNDGYFGQAGGRNVVLAPPFLRRLLGAPTPSGLLVAHSDRPQIDEYGADGSLRRSIRIAEGILASSITDPGSVTDSMLALTPEPTRQVLAQAIREIPVPDRWPSMGEIMVDDQERLWIQSYRALGQQSVTWRIFASDGSYLGAFEVPHRFEAHDVRGNLMAGVWTGDLDLESVRVYRIDVPDAAPDPAAESPDDTAQVEHLRAFALLYGHVRWFHPSDEAADVAWDHFAVLGAERVRNLQDPAELQAELERLFSPIAPTLRLYADGTPAPPPPPETSPPATAGLEVVAWQHLGMGSGIAANVYQSARLNRERVLTPASQAGILTQSLDAEPLRGRQIRLTATVRTLEPGAQGQLWLRVDLEGGQQGFFDNMADRPVRSPETAEVGIQGPVDPQASRILLGSITQNGGVAYGGIRLEVREDDGSWRRVPLANDDLTRPVETAGSIPGWSAPGQGWTVEALPPDDAPQPTLHVTPQRFTMSGRLFEAAPAPGERMAVELGSGITALLPLSLYSRDGRTLPAPDPDGAAWLEAELRRVGERRTRATPESRDQALRIADVVVAWNVFQHFYPYFDVVDVDWDAVLTEGLQRALLPRTHGEFQRDLEWLVAQLEDGHGSVTGPAPAPTGRLPASFERIEGQVVVAAATEDSGLQRGDVVTRLDGTASEALLEQEAERFSGSVQWREFRALGELGRGAPGETVRVDLLRQGDPETVQLPRVAGPPPEDPRPDPIAELEPGIFYVDLDRVPMEAFEARVEELAEADGVVFDLRGYPNGNHLILSHLSDEPLQSAFWRVPRIIRPDFQEPVEYQESRWQLPPRTPRIGGRIAFITDGRAISYAESVMGIVEHYGLGDIVGGPTAGANGNVNPFTLPGGSRVVWTGMRVENHDRTLLHGKGIPPTHPVERTIAGVRDGRDELLEAALDRVR